METPTEYNKHWSPVIRQMTEEQIAASAQAAPRNRKAIVRVGIGDGLGPSRIKLSKKKRRQIEDALDEAAWQATERFIDKASERPPDDWSPEERIAFDAIHEAKEKLREKILRLFGPNVQSEPRHEQR